MSAASPSPAYWARAKRELSRADPVMAGIIRRFPAAVLEPRHDPFVTLARAIVGQQISVQAARTVWGRLESKAGEVKPLRLARMRLPTLQACGLSGRKAEYVRELAQHFEQGKLRVDLWDGMDDEEIIQDLIQVRGVGRWTAEMFLIFNLLRPDVLPLDDVGLHNGVKLAYDSANRYREKSATRDLRRHCEELAEQWRPWRSVATFYLWRSLDVVALKPEKKSKETG